MLILCKLFSAVRQIKLKKVLILVEICMEREKSVMLTKSEMLNLPQE